MQKIYEHFFLLMYHSNWDFQQAYALPVGLRKWFVERLVRQKEEEKEIIENAGKQRQHLS